MLQNNMGDLVFDNRKERISVFVYPVVVMPVIAMVFILPKTLGKAIQGYQREMLITLTALALGFAIGLILGTISAIRFKKMIITVNDKGVDVIKGRTHGFYELKDYVGGQCKTVMRGRSFKVIRSLVFNDEEFDTLYIDCDGFSEKKFLWLADAVSIRKHIVLDEEKDVLEEQLDDDRFEGKYSFKTDKSIVFLCVFFCFPVILIWFVEVYFLFTAGISLLTGMLGICSVIATLSSMFVISASVVSVKRNKARVIRNLSVNATGLQINDDVWEYDRIKSVYATPPYLTRVGEEHREIEIRYRDTDKIKTYLVEKRPEEQNPSDEYRRLYNSLTVLCESKGIKMEMFSMQGNYISKKQRTDMSLVE